MRPYDGWVAYIIAAMIHKDIRQRYAINLTVDVEASNRIVGAANTARLEFNNSYRNTMVTVPLPLLFPHNNSLIHYQCDIFDTEIDRMIVNLLLGVMP